MRIEAVKNNFNGKFYKFGGVKLPFKVSSCRRVSSKMGVKLKSTTFTEYRHTFVPGRGKREQL